MSEHLDLDAAKKIAKTLKGWVIVRGCDFYPYFYLVKPVFLTWQIRPASARVRFRTNFVRCATWVLSQTVGMVKTYITKLMMSTLKDSLTLP